MTLSVSQELGPADTDGDRALLARLVANLLDNAAQHNTPNGRVEVRTFTDGEHAILSIRNSGPEIAADQVSRLLEPFQRLEPGRSNADGLRHGLGLSIVATIALAHSAVLTIRAQEGGGLAVAVAFPSRAAS